VRSTRRASSFFMTARTAKARVCGLRRLQNEPPNLHADLQGSMIAPWPTNRKA
jgi:hypothetical protein